MEPLPAALAEQPEIGKEIAGDAGNKVKSGKKLKKDRRRRRKSVDSCADENAAMQASIVAATVKVEPPDEQLVQDSSG